MVSSYLTYWNLALFQEAGCAGDGRAALAWHLLCLVRVEGQLCLGGLGTLHLNGLNLNLVLQDVIKLVRIVEESCSCLGSAINKTTHYHWVMFWHDGIAMRVLITHEIFRPTGILGCLIKRHTKTTS